ncbi:hypothetical protein OG21DRAFT_676294 [Imleria badia]|nr:hypothetical protein OG21DRAFT_676294 [Imleria badia]
MSLSVDDLVASLSASHIGQEATDLAALQVCPFHLPHTALRRSLSRSLLPLSLQAQLAQTLLTHQLSLSPSHPHTSAFVHGVSVNVARRDPANVQHCTTPTARTPSSASCTWPLPLTDHADHARRRSVSYARRQSIDDGWCDFEEMADERAVEDMVTPDSPRAQNTYLWSSHKGDAHGSVTRVLSTPASTPLSASNMSSPTDSCASSLFTSTDPFYLQASQPTQQSHTSFFSHVGMPSSHSPFMVGVPSWE